jgi:hypothetical protein
MPTSQLRALIDDSAEPEATTRLRYEPHGVRKTAFCIVFLLLLPFYASLPAMIYQRVAAGVWLDTWGLLVIAVAFTVLMVLLVFEVIYALRAEIEIGDTEVRFVLPAGGPGAIPMFNYREQAVPYDKIRGVEHRTEVYGGTFAPVLMRSTWLRMDHDRKILLGAVNATCTDNIFPFDEIARQIAERAGIAVVDKGMVKRPIKDAVLGLAHGESQDASLGEAAIADVNSRHRQFVWAIVSVFVFLLAMGVASDFLERGTDLGERSPNTALTLF